jgi:hypothetical protein
MKSYIAPHLRKPAPPPEVKVDLSSTMMFPGLGSTRVTSPRAPETSLASRAKEWSDRVEVVVDTDRVAKLRESATRDAKTALRVFYNQPYMKKIEYVRQDDLFQNRLDELEYEEALEYAEQDGEVQTPEEEEWTDVKYKVARERVFRDYSPPCDGTTDSELRERIELLQKRMRKNGVLREDKQSIEEELRELQKKLNLSVEVSTVPKDSKYWE